MKVYHCPTHNRSTKSNHHTIYRPVLKSAKPRFKSQYPSYQLHYLRQVLSPLVASSVYQFIKGKNHLMHGIAVRILSKALSTGYSINLTFLPLPSFLLFEQNKTYSKTNVAIYSSSKNNEYSKYVLIQNAFLMLLFTG